MIETGIVPLAEFMASSGPPPQVEDMNEESTLRNSLTDGLGLPDEAVDWLCDLYMVAQFYDDVADGDEIDRADLNRALYVSLVEMNVNQFFVANSASLLPVVATAIMKWQGSDMAETGGDADEMSFSWRASFYDVVTMVYLLCNGRVATESASLALMNMYGETYSEYKKEFV